MERRKHQRYDVEAPLTFSWQDSKNVHRRQRALLSNISGNGLFVSTLYSPPKGACIHASVSFRTVFGGTPLLLRAVATVVRVELPAVEGRDGFAAAIKTFTLHNDPNLLWEGEVTCMGLKARNI
jgi:hypothetical protein